MIYRNFDELAFAVLNMGLYDLDEGVKLSKLCIIYLDAKNNPPQGVIGVGAISYAERVLVAAQKEA